MKTRLFLSSLFACSFLFTFGQNNSSPHLSTLTPHPTKPVVIHHSSNDNISSNSGTYPITVHSGSSQQSTPGTSPTLTVAQIDQLIAAYQAKVDYYTADPVQKEQVTQSGWLEKMSQSINELKLKKQALLNN